MNKILLTVLFLYLVNFDCNAQTVKPPSATEICRDVKFQISSRAVSDGDGGAIIFWKDEREAPSSGGYTIFTQRINKDGVIKWKKNGIKVCPGTQENDIPTAVSDGKGGAIVAWEDVRNSGHSYDIYAQRINADGVLQWDSNGVPVCKIIGEQQKIDLTSDGDEGAFIVWHDSRIGNDPAIYAQRIIANGITKWITNGVLISKVGYTDQKPDPKVVSDGKEGAIITWDDYYNKDLKHGIYAQRLDSEGKMLWNENSVYVAEGKVFYPTIISDGANGAIIGWEHFREGFGIGVNISIQHLDSNGVVKWGTKPISIFDLDVSERKKSKMVSDEHGGAIITWNDGRASLYYPNIYAQRVNADGVIQWTKNGLSIAANVNESENTPQIVKDGAGGAIITWDRTKYGIGTSIFAQSINASGELQWNNGEGIYFPQSGFGSNIVSDELGGAIVTWSYGVSAGNNDIYAQRIGVKGHLSVVDHVGLKTTSLAIFPNPVNNFLILNSLDQIQDISILNENGQTVLKLTGDVKKVDFSSFSTGLYIMNISTNKQKITRKVIKK